MVFGIMFGFVRIGECKKEVLYGSNSYFRYWIYFFDNDIVYI